MIVGGALVQIVLAALDIAIILLDLLLAGFLRLYFFYLAFLLMTIVALLAVHFARGYSWIFVLKLAAEFVVPLIMAWAGVHLAAEVKEKNEKVAWQLAFGALFFVGFMGGLFVELNVVDEHTRELQIQRLEIKNDMAEELVKYNDSHPQHPVTSDQFSQLMKGVFAQNTSQTLLQGMSDSLISVKAQSVAQQLWAAFDKKHGKEWAALETFSSKSMGKSGDDIKKLAQDRALADSESAEDYVRTLAVVLPEANLYRAAIRQRLAPSNPETADDQKWESDFTVNAAAPRSSFQGILAAQYLIRIAQELSH
jgi:hypothetical protein